MIARAADIHFSDTQEETRMALWEKVMLIMDELFLLVDNWKTILPQWTEEEEDI